MKKNNKILLFTNDLNIKQYLNQYLTNEKNHELISNALNALGKFNRYAQLELYDFISNENDTIVRAACMDINGTIFIINIFSNKKRDYKILEVVNENDFIYDLSIIKNTILSKENIELCKKNNELNTKFGRICTDNKTYYNILFGKDAFVLVQGEFSNIANDILKQINMFENIPNVYEIFSMFEHINKIALDNCVVYSISIYGKNEKLVNKIEFTQENQLVRKKVK